MPTKYSTRLGQEEVQILKHLSETTRIPQSKLLEEAIHLLDAQYENDIVTPAFRRKVDASIARHRPLLKRLAE